MRLYPGRIERYVAGRVVRALGATLALICAIVLLINFVSLARDVGSRVQISFIKMAALSLMQAPATVLTLSPFAFLFGALAAFIGLNRRSELTAMRAAGVSAWRFIAPAAAVAFVSGVLVVTVFTPLAGLLNTQFETQRDMALSGYLNQKAKPSWLRQGDADTQVVIRAQNQERLRGSVRLQGVSLFVYSKDSSGVMRFSRRIEAAQARLDPGFWRLTKVRETVPGAGSIQSESLTIPSNLDPEQAAARFGSGQSIAFWRLPHAIASGEQAGFSTVDYRIQLQQLFATPLLFAAMAILAAAFSLRLMRLGGVAALAGLGVALGFGFFFLNEVCAALGRAEVISPILAAWAPPLLALLSGLTLLCHTEDG